MKKESGFTDYQGAAFAKQKAEERLGNMKKAFIVSLIAQVAVIIFPGIFGMINEDWTMAGFVAGFAISIVAYCMVGGLGWLVQLIIKIGKICWFIIPLFPIDLLLGFMGVCMSGGLILFSPVATIGILYLLTKHDYKKAEEYINFCNNNAPTA